MVSVASARGEHGPPNIPLTPVCSPRNLVQKSKVVYQDCISLWVWLLCLRPPLSQHPLRIIYAEGGYRNTPSFCPCLSSPPATAASGGC